MKTPDSTIFTLRMPTAMRKAIEARAQKEGRSLSNVVLRMLTRGLKERVKS